MEQISKKAGTGLRMVKSTSVGLVVKKYWSAVLQLNTQLDQLNSEVWTGIVLFTCSCLINLVCSQSAVFCYYSINYQLFKNVFNQS